MKLLVEPDAEAAARATADLLAETAAAGGHVFLCGGSTPRRAYELAADGDWSHAHVWWGDERCVPPEDELSNYRLAKESLLDRLAGRPHVHRIRGELDPAEAAGEYDRALAGITPDLVLLGIGGDGHTASLFPGSPALEERARRAVAAPPGLEPFVERVTLTLPAIASARRVVFLVTGADKAEPTRRAFGPPDPSTPASLARSASGETIAILDRPASSLLDN